MIVVSESGVYRLVFRSRKPKAEQFKRWLAHDVLPQIRRTGRFDNGAPPDRFDAIVAPLGQVRARLELVREARAIFGPQRAAELWRTLELPAMPSATELASDDASQCLQYLLGCMLDDNATVYGHLLQALSDNATSEAQLRKHGIRTFGDTETTRGFIVAATHKGATGLYAGTEWAEFKHTNPLRRLIGAHATGAMKFVGPKASRGTFIPAIFLDEV